MIQWIFNGEVWSVTWSKHPYLLVELVPVPIMCEISDKNNEWNKQALAMSEKRRRAWPFDPAHIPDDKP